MAGWCSDSESDDEPLNLNLFIRKSFGFEGLPEEKENVLKNVVQGLGATCDDLPKYIFTTRDYFLALTGNSNSLYNVTYIRDCIDANRCLSIDQYRFGPKYSEKKDFREFEPCCQNFHDGEAACIVCDPTLKKIKDEVPVVKEKKVKEKTTTLAVIESNVPTKKIKSKMCQFKECPLGSKPHKYHKKLRNSWEPWEHRLLLDYIIGNNLFEYCKSPSLYKRMVAQGFLKHRSPESLRVQFRTKILKTIDSFNLPKQILQKFKRMQSLKVKGSYSLQKLMGKTRFKDLVIYEQ